MCSIKPRTSFCQKRDLNRQTDTKVLILYRLPFSGILSLLKKKQKLRRKQSGSTPVMVLMLLRRRQKGFPVSTQIIGPHFSLEDPQPYLPESHILNCKFRQSCTRQKNCFPGTVILFLGGCHAVEA